jgi:hypothetical protein
MLRLAACRRIATGQEGVYRERRAHTRRCETTSKQDGGELQGPESGTCGFASTRVAD